LAAPDGIKGDDGLPAPGLEDKVDQLKRRLFKFYRMYNPDKMYEAPEISKSYVDRQEMLNASLKKRYTVDLNTYSLRTPSPFKKTFKTFQSPYANHHSRVQNTNGANVKKFSLAGVDKDDLLASETNTSRVSKGMHAHQTAKRNNAGTTVETYGGRETVKNVLEDTVKTWDSASTSAQQPAAQLQTAAYLLRGHGQQTGTEAAPVAVNVKEQPKSDSSLNHQDRTKTIVTLMGTIKLLEAKNTELLKSRQHVDAELQQERIRSSNLQAQVSDMQQQMRSLKNRHEVNLAKGERFAQQQDENQYVNNMPREDTRISNKPKQVYMHEQPPLQAGRQQGGGLAEPTETYC